MAEDLIRIRIQTDDKSSGQNKKIAQSLGAIDKAAGGSKKSLMSLGGYMVGGLKAAMGVGVLAIGGLSAVIGKSVTTSADMEQAVADIAAIMGMTAEETGKVKDLINDLGIDPNLKVSAVEAGEAIAMLAKNELAWSEISEGAAKNVVLLANSTGSDFGTAADIATDAMALFNIKAEDMSGVVNSITGLVNNSKFDINDYALAIGNGASKMAGMGIQFDEFNTLIAATSSSFTSGQTAGTSFSNLFTRLVPSTANATEAFRELGLVTEEGGNVFFDAEGKFLGVENVVDKLGAAMATLSEEERITFANMAVGQDAMPALNAIAALTTDTFNEMGDALKGTDALESAAVRADTLKGSLEILDGIVEVITIGIGDAFNPAFRDMVQVFSDFLGENADNIIEFFEAFAKKISSGAVVVADIVKVLIEFAKTGDLVAASELAMTEELKPLFEKMGSFINTVKSVASVLKDWLKPITSLISENVELKDILIAFGVALAVVVIPAVASFVAAAGLVALQVAALIAIVTTLRTAWENDWGGLRSTIVPIVSAIADSIGVILSTIKELVSDGELSLDDLVRILGVVAGEVAAAFKAFAESATLKLSEWKDSLIDWGLAMAQWIIDATPGVLTALGEWLAAITQYIIDSLPSMAGTLVEWGLALWDWIVVAIPIVTEKMTAWAESITTYLVEALPGVVGNLLTWGGAFVQWIIDTIPNVILQMGAWAASIFSFLTEKLVSFTTKLGGWAVELVTWISDLDMIEVFGTWFASIVEFFEEFLDPFIETLEVWGEELWNWITNAEGETVSTLTDWAGEVGATISSHLPAIKTRLSEWSFALYNWISNSENDTKKTFDDWAKSSLLDKIIALNFTLGTELAESGKKLVKWISDAVPNSLKASTDWLVSVVAGIDLGKNAVASDDLATAGIKMKDAFLDIVDTISTSLLANGGKLATSIMGAFYTKMVEDMPDLRYNTFSEFDKVKVAIFQGLGAVDNGATNLYNTGAVAVSNIFSGITTTIRNGINAVTQEVWPQFEKIQEAIFDGLWVSKKDGVGHVGVHAFNLIFDSMTSTINDKIDGFRNHVTNIFTSVKDKIQEALNQSIFEGIGRDIVQGMINGMDSLIDRLKQMAQTVADSIPQWIRDALGIGSQSRVMIDIGQNVTKSLIMGMAQPNIVESATRLGDTVSQSVNNAVTNNRVTNNTFNVQTGNGRGDNSLSGDINLLNKLYAGV